MESSSRVSCARSVIDCDALHDDDERMTNYRLTALLAAVVLGVFVLSLTWEMVLEARVLPQFLTDHEQEKAGERWEYVITATLFSAIALSIPGLLLFRAHNRLTRLNSELELRVERQLAEHLQVERALGSETTERQHAQSLNTRFASIIENTVNEVYLFDATTLRFVQVNRSGRENLGLSMRQLATLSCDKIIPYWSRETLNEKLSVVRDGGADEVVFETTHVREDGTGYDVEVRIQYMPNEDPPLYVAFVQDITERKHAERALIQARENAEAANREKSRFLATMSHEMRTPLNSMLGLTELLLTSDLDATQRELARGAHQSTGLLLDMIGALLDQSKIEAGKVRLEAVRFDLRKTVEDAVGLIADKADAGRLRVTANIPDQLPTQVYGDQRHFRQVLTNLLSNAFKFTHDGAIEVECSAVEQTPDRLSLRTTVRDTGIGIPPEQHGRIFESFTQVDGSTTRRYEGMGLGLAIAKELVELMHGEIGVQSEPGKGSVFHFCVPLAIHPSATSAGTAALEDGNATAAPIPLPARVLVAEDNPVSAFAAQEMLKRLGCQVSVVGNGREAIEAFKQQSFDLVLMDCWMPEVDGFEATETIRDYERDNRPSPHTPIVANTAHAMKIDQDRCLTAGMDDYMSKPVTLEKLRTIVQRWTATQPNQQKSSH